MQASAWRYLYFLELCNILNKIRQPFNVNSFAQELACEAINDKEHIKKSIDLNLAEGAFLFAELTQLGLECIPSVGNFISFKGNFNAEELFINLMKEGVIVRPIGLYDMPEFIRVTAKKRNYYVSFIKIIMNSIVIIGLGLMGGSVAKALKNKNPEILISAFDHNDSALDLALDVGIIDKKISTLEEINKLNSKDVDIIIIAVPVIESLKVFDAINGLFNSDVTITDTASAKSLISNHLEENYSSPTNIILSHPMAGSHNTGVGYADEAILITKKFSL